MTQEYWVKDWLEQGRTITPLEALNHFGCFRLSAIIFKLKAKGMDIRTINIRKDDKNFAQYELVPKDVTEQIRLKGI